jgi:GGDEF domain-containing protein
VAEPADRSEHAPSRQRRARRFVLPVDRHDERTAARIEAFLEGPSTPSGRRGLAIDDRDRPRRPHELDTRPDWTTALVHESSRHARYGRPASVLLIELRGFDGSSLERAAQTLADLIRAEVRETDRAVRMGPASFRMLLTETSARAARHVAARLERAFHDGRSDPPGPPKVRIEIAAPTRGESLDDAVIAAERRLA